MKNKISGFLTATMLCIILFLIFCLDVLMTKNEKTKKKYKQTIMLLNNYQDIVYTTFKQHIQEDILDKDNEIEGFTVNSQQNHTV